MVGKGGLYRGIADDLRGDKDISIHVKPPANFSFPGLIFPGLIVKKCGMVP